MAKKHSSEAFYALDDPLGAAIFFFGAGGDVKVTLRNGCRLGVERMGQNCSGQADRL